MSNPQGRNEDLHHAHHNGVSILELSRRTLIPAYTLRCMMEHETCTDCGGPDAEIQNTGDLRRVLHRDLHTVSGVHDVLGRRRE